MSKPTEYARTDLAFCAWQRRKRQRTINFTQAGAPPAESPLKVFDGAAWRVAGVKVE